MHIKLYIEDNIVFLLFLLFLLFLPFLLCRKTDTPNNDPGYFHCSVKRSNDLGETNVAFCTNLGFSFDPTLVDRDGGPNRLPLAKLNKMAVSKTQWEQTIAMQKLDSDADEIHSDSCPIQYGAAFQACMVIVFIRRIADLLNILPSPFILSPLFLYFPLSFFVYRYRLQSNRLVYPLEHSYIFNYRKCTTHLRTLIYM